MTASRAARDWLLADQAEEGYWWGELEANVSITAEYLLLTHHLGIGDPEQWEQIARYLRHHQQPEGYWAQWWGGPGELSTSNRGLLCAQARGRGPVGAAHGSRA